MLAVGDSVPDATIATSPSERRTIAELGEGKPALLLFYLFDWSST